MRRSIPLPHRLPPAIKALLAVVAVSVIFVGTGWGATSADAPDSLTTRLEPGINYIGWVSADTPVEDFFASVPQVEAVFAWSARNEEWLRAAPGVPAEFNTLNWLTPGMGLVVRLGGDQPVQWTRAFSRASGLIGLRSGLNLVAWTGGRATLLSEIERDLRRSFGAQYGEAGANDPDRLYTPDQPETVDAFGRVEHGGALWVRAEVLGSWSQRSDDRLIIRGRVIDPDGEGLEGLYVQATIEGRLGWYFPYITNADGSFLMFALADSKLTISFRHREGCSSYYREGGTTEQLDEATRIDTSVPVNDLEFHVGDGACGRHIRGRLMDATGAPIADQFVSARALSAGRGGSDRTAEDGSFEILVPDHAEYALRTEVVPGCETWYDGDGLTRERDNAAAVAVSGADVTGLEIRVPDDVCAWQIRGRVLNHDGTPYPAVQVQPVGPDHRHIGSTYTSEDGSFTVAVPQPGLYRLRVWTNDCSGYYADGELTAELEQALAIEVTGDEATELVLRMPERSCIWEIRGRLMRADGPAVEDTRVVAAAVNSAVEYLAWTAADGSFTITPRTEGPFVLRAEVGGSCHVFLSDEGISLSVSGGTHFSRGDANVTNVDFRLPDGTCEFRVQGRIVRANGEPLGGEIVVVSRDRWSSSADTEADGSFEFHLPVQGEYRMLFRLAPNCWAYYDGGRLTPSRPSEPGVQAGTARTTDLTIRVPEGLCSLQIRGVLIGSDGMPLGGRSVFASSEEGHPRTVTGTESDGSFAVTVPVAGSYRVWAYYLIDGCRAVYREGGVARDLADGTVIFVDADHVDSIIVRAPETSCIRQISGRVTGEDGGGIAGIKVEAEARGNLERYSSRTAADGSFTITARQDDHYLLYIYPKERCFVRYAEGGVTDSVWLGTTITVDQANVADVHIRLPNGVCERKIHGHVIDANGQPLAGVSLRSYGIETLVNTDPTETAADGSFSLVVALSGSYSLTVWPKPGCAVFYATPVSTTDSAAVEYIDVTDTDVSGIRVQIAADACEGG